MAAVEKPSVFALKHPGVLVLLGRGEGGQVLVDALDILALVGVAGLGLGQPLKVEAQGVEAVLPRGLGGLLGGLGGGLRGGDGVVQKLPQGRGGRTGHGVLQLQAQGGGQAEVGDGGVGGKLIGVVVLHPAQGGQQEGGELAGHQRRSHDDAHRAVLSLLGDHAGAEEDIGGQRDKGEEDEGDEVDDDPAHGGAEAAHHVPGHDAHEAHAVVQPEHGPAAPLHAEEHGAQPQYRPSGDPGRPPPGQQVQDEGQRQPRGGGKEHNAQQGQLKEGHVPVKQAQQQLVVEDGGGKEQDGQRRPAQVPPAGVTGAAGEIMIHQTVTS